jgi:hypothetical protein
MVETEGLSTGLAKEREEVELVAVIELAVLANQRGIFGVVEHFDVARLLRVWVR